jgi:hypothetical protein
MLDHGECPDAVVLQLENPAGIIEWRTPLQERHWLELQGHQCNQNSTSGPFHLLRCGETILLFPLWQQPRKRELRSVPRVVASILCIDDDSRIFDLYKVLLGAKGYTVLTAPDGPTGLAITRKYSVRCGRARFQNAGVGRQSSRSGADAGASEAARRDL